MTFGNYSMFIGLTILYINDLDSMLSDNQRDFLSLLKNQPIR